MSILKEASLPFFNLGAYIGNKVHPNRNKGVFIVSGSPRGGTTWLAESMARLLKTRRIYWEPLQDGNISLPQSLKFSKRPFIEPTEGIDERSKQFFDDLINARLANMHLLRVRRRPSNLKSLLFSPAPPLFKFVRGNGILGYLHQNYDIHKPLVIIRHPCAVIASQLSMGSWEDHPHVSPKILERYSQIRNIVSTEKPLHQRLAMTWAADVLAARESPGDVHTLYYEDLVQLGSEALAPVMADWGIEYKGVDEALAIPSSTTHDWSDLRDVERKLGRWRQQLSDEIADEILNIAVATGVEDYGVGLVPGRR